MRLSEVATIDAIVLDGPVPHFDLAGARRRTGAGGRGVPSPPRLLPLRAGIEPFRLEPKVLGKRFARWKERAGVDRARTDFHSLRKNVAEAWETAGVAENEAAAFLGHKHGRGFTFTVYNPHGPGMERLQAAVRTIGYEGLELRHRPVPQAAARGEKAEPNQWSTGMASPRGLEPLFSP